MGGFSRRELVAKANEVVSIYLVCDKVGVEYATYMGDRAKLYCPFGAITHMDGGESRAFRIYEDTNSSYCFACSQYYTPVRLYSDYTDLSEEDAAEELLNEVGWKDETFEEKWESLTVPEGAYDPSYLPEALHTYCARLDPDWVVTQMSEPHRSAITLCVRASRAVTSAKQADQWLVAAKEKMRKVIHDSE